jgi:hypothetical protein
MKHLHLRYVHPEYYIQPTQQHIKGSRTQRQDYFPCQADSNSQACHLINLLQIHIIVRNLVDTCL